MRVRDLMTKDVVFCAPSDSLNRAAQLMWEGDCGAIPVLGPKREVLGMITDRDICISAHLRGRLLSDIAVGDVMARDIHVCGPADSIEVGEAIMRDNQVRRLPVVDEYGALVAIISMADVARRLSARPPPPEHAQPLMIETLGQISARRGKAPN